MGADKRKRITWSLGYPDADLVQRACADRALREPDIVHRTCKAKLHHLSRREQAALLEVVRINTLAGGWMLRDIEQRNPEQRFAIYRMRNSTHYNTEEIARVLEKLYRSKIRGRYTLNTHLFTGLCGAVAGMVSLWLNRMAEARAKGYLQRHQEGAAYVIEVGQDAGKLLGRVGRKTVFGYAFLAPTSTQRQEVLHHIDVLLSDDGDDEAAYLAAERFTMPIRPYKGRMLGIMRRQTLERVQAILNRDEERAEQIERRRAAAHELLRFSPPSGTTVGRDGLSVGRRRELAAEYDDGLVAFAALPKLGNDDPDGMSLTEDERVLFRELQQRAYAATDPPTYLPLHWTRADGCVAGRDMGVAYDAEKIGT